MILKIYKDRTSPIFVDKSSSISHEVQNKVAEIIKRVEYLPSSHKGECELPDELIKGITCCLLSYIIMFIELKKRKEELERWKNSDSARQKQKK